MEPDEALMMHPCGKWVMKPSGNITSAIPTKNNLPLQLKTSLPKSSVPSLVFTGMDT